MPPPSSLFVSFEGIDGSGKSTQARLLATTLRKRGHDVVEVREPGGTSLGEDIRTLLLDPSRTVTPKAELLLFAAARAELVETLIRPALENGSVVVADRFSDSTVAYQGGGRSIQSVEWLTELNRFVTGGVAPNRTYWIDTPVHVARHRLGDSGEDRMESSGPEFYRRVVSAYSLLVGVQPDRIVRLDGTQPVETLQRQVLSGLDTLSSTRAGDQF